MSARAVLFCLVNLLLLRVEQLIPDTIMTDEPSKPKLRSDNEAATARSALTGETAAAEGPAILEFEQIANGANSLLIRLGTEIYTLRRTHSGKLILNK
jgi:hemin uptake protein HemP